MAYVRLNRLLVASGAVKAARTMVKIGGPIAPAATDSFKLVRVERRPATAQGEPLSLSRAIRMRRCRAGGNPKEELKKILPGVFLNSFNEETSAKIVATARIIGTDIFTTLFPLKIYHDEVANALLVLSQSIDMIEDGDMDLFHAALKDSRSKNPNDPTLTIYAFASLLQEYRHWSRLDPKIKWLMLSNNSIIDWSMRRAIDFNAIELIDSPELAEEFLPGNPRRSPGLKYLLPYEHILRSLDADLRREFLTIRMPHGSILSEMRSSPAYGIFGPSWMAELIVEITAADIPAIEERIAATPLSAQAQHWLLEMLKEEIAKSITFASFDRFTYLNGNAIRFLNSAVCGRDLDISRDRDLSTSLMVGRLVIRRLSEISKEIGISQQELDELVFKQAIHNLDVTIKDSLAAVTPLEGFESQIFRERRWRDLITKEEPTALGRTFERTYRLNKDLSLQISYGMFESASGFNISIMLDKSQDKIATIGFNETAEAIQIVCYHGGGESKELFINSFDSYTSGALPPIQWLAYAVCRPLLAAAIKSGRRLEWIDGRSVLCAYPHSTGEAPPGVATIKDAVRLFDAPSKEFAAMSKSVESEIKIGLHFGNAKTGRELFQRMERDPNQVIRLYISGAAGLGFDRSEDRPWRVYNKSLAEMDRGILARVSDDKKERFKSGIASFDEVTFDRIFNLAGAGDPIPKQLREKDGSGSRSKQYAISAIERLPFWQDLILEYRTMGVLPAEAEGTLDHREMLGSYISGKLSRLPSREDVEMLTTIVAQDRSYESVIEDATISSEDGIIITDDYVQYFKLELEDEAAYLKAILGREVRIGAISSDGRALADGINKKMGDQFPIAKPMEGESERDFVGRMDIIISGPFPFAGGEKVGKLKKQMRAGTWNLSSATDRGDEISDIELATTIGDNPEKRLFLISRDIDTSGSREFWAYTGERLIKRALPEIPITTSREILDWSQSGNGLKISMIQSTEPISSK